MHILIDEFMLIFYNLMFPGLVWPLNGLVLFVRLWDRTHSELIITDHANYENWSEKVLLVDCWWFALTDIGVTTEEWSSLIRFEDLPPSNLLINRRIIRQYLVKGYASAATIEMTEVNKILNTPVATAGTLYPQVPLQYN